MAQSRRTPFLQRLLANGTEIGENDQRISVTGPPGDINFFAFTPAIAFSRDFAHDYLIVWTAVDGSVGAREGREIYGQRVSDGGAFIGNKFRISTMGPDFDTLFDAIDPDVAFNTTDFEFLVTWTGDDDRGALINEELEIYGQRLSEIGAEVGPDDLRLSKFGPDASPAFFAGGSSVAYSPTSHTFGISWQGDDNTPPLVDNEGEVFFQRFLNGASLFADGFESGDTSLWSTTSP